MYAIREAFKGMLRTRYMTFVSIVTILVTLTLLGILGVVTIFTHGLVNKIRGSEEINVYLEDEMPDEDMLALDASIAMMSEVKSTKILSKEDAAKEFEKMFGRELLTALDENPLPRTIVVVMAEGHRASEDLETVASRISKVNFIESVEYGREWMSKLDIFFLFFVVGETVLVTLSLGACMLVISNTISLTVLARKDTIDIMRLVGATDGFIRRPFYV
ncbi:MAG: ABC transporter permease, partial [Candidatus Latescibacteria bacterium]|nr:ABC transporter permease [Candidatus Latescibacterota bacterium]